VTLIGGASGILPHIFPIFATIFLILRSGGSLTGFGSFAMAGIWPIVYGGLIIGTYSYRMGGIRL
jgi:hypothetical protein